MFNEYSNGIQIDPLRRIFLFITIVIPSSVFLLFKGYVLHNTTQWRWESEGGLYKNSVERNGEQP